MFILKKNNLYANKTRTKEAKLVAIKAFEDIAIASRRVAPKAIGATVGLAASVVVGPVIQAVCYVLGADSTADAEEKTH